MAKCQEETSLVQRLPATAWRMIININSWPGVGKLSIAERLHQNIGGRLLDNHTIFNVAFSLCDFKSPEFYEAARAVRRIAFDAVSKLPSNVPVIVTSAYADTRFGRENWAAIRDLACSRGSPLFNVVLDCSLNENIRRLQSPGRERLRKLTEAAPLVRSRSSAQLLCDGGDHMLRIDVTELTPEDAASRIERWLRDPVLLPRPRLGEKRRRVRVNYRAKADV
jgi:hypothetical protein